MDRLKKGYLVRIRKDSEFADQNDSEGANNTIGKVEHSDGDGWYVVRFENGYHNSYMQKDLNIIQGEEQEDLVLKSAIEVSYRRSSRRTRRCG